MSKSGAVGTLLQVAAIAAAAAALVTGNPGLAAALTKTAFALSAASAVQQNAYQRQKARSLYNASLSDRTVMTATYDGIRSRCYGRVRNVDGVVFKGTRGDKSQYYTLVVALAGHEIDAVETVYFNDVALTLDASGKVLTAPYGSTSRVSVSQDVTGVFSYDVGSDAILSTVALTKHETLRNHYVTFTISGTVVSWTDPATTLTWQKSVQGSKATVKIYTGAPGQDLSGELSTRFPTLINSTHKFSGFACLLVDLEYDENAFTSGVPTITAVMRGAKVYDPRTGTTGWSQNPALCLRDWALYAHGGGCSTTEVDDPAFIAAANACDVSHTYTDSNGVSSTVPLYRCDYVCKLDVSPETHFSEMVEAMAGKWGWAGGKIRVRAGTYTTPVATLDDSWLNDAAGSRQIVPEYGMAAMINSYRITIADQTQNWQSTQLPPLTPSAYVTEDGCELSSEIEMGAVSFSPQALNVAGIMLRDLRQGMTIKWPCNLKAWSLNLFDTVAINSSRYGWTAKVFEVIGWERTLLTGIVLTLKETGAIIYSPDAIFTAVDQIPNTSLPKPWDVPGITGLTVAVDDANVVKGVGGSIVSRVKLTFDPIYDQSVLVGGQIEASWFDGVTWSSQMFPGDSAFVYLNGLLNDSYYLFKVRARNRLAVGDWSNQVGFRVVPTVNLPSNPTGLLAQQIPGGVQVSWDHPADADYAYTEVRIGASGWSSASSLTRTNSDKFVWAWPSAGTYTVLIKHFDQFGSESATATTTSVTVDNGSLIGNNQAHPGLAIGPNTVKLAADATITYLSPNWQQVMNMTITPDGNSGANVQVVVSLDSILDFTGGASSPVPGISYAQIAIGVQGSTGTYRRILDKSLPVGSLSEVNAVGSVTFTVAAGTAVTFAIYANKFVTDDVMVIKAGAVMKAQVIGS